MINLGHLLVLEVCKLLETISNTVHRTLNLFLFEKYSETTPLCGRESLPKRLTNLPIKIIPHLPNFLHIPRYLTQTEYKSSLGEPKRLPDTPTRSPKATIAIFS